MSNVLSTMSNYPYLFKPELVTKFGQTKPERDLIFNSGWTDCPAFRWKSCDLSGQTWVIVFVHANFQSLSGQCQCRQACLIVGTTHTCLIHLHLYYPVTTTWPSLAMLQTLLHITFRRLLCIQVFLTQFNKRSHT
uniref:Uncharacterized protein n=2 Tax=Opuntia streptacantha TaxID=393608 RepID=A0A7C9E0H3_OPUST